MELFSFVPATIIVVLFFKNKLLLIFVQNMFNEINSAMRNFILSCALLGAFPASAQTLTADFTAAEAARTCYYQGFDSEEDLSDWSFQVTNEDATWHLAERPYVAGLPAFTVFNPESKYSLAIRYDDYSQQNETAFSPVVHIEPGSRCEFYLCFSGGLLVFADLTLSVTDMATNETTQMFSAFQWAQEVGYDGPNWMPFEFDLAEYAGCDVRFSFNYQGSGGEDMLVDDFRVVQEDLSGDSRVNINEGDAVHFEDLSAGNPSSWEWEFEGGEPSSSSGQNPVVVYPRAGTYKVSLTVADGQARHSVTKEGFVQVTAVAPTAKIGLPEDAYLSPWAACFVPVGVPLQFRDLSEGHPTAWEWQLQGTDCPESNEQNPVASYMADGVYSLSLRVSNSAGVHTDMLQYAVQAGGAQYIWNISPEENASLAPAYLSFFGYYGGSNWLGMQAFAEYFAKPLAKATVSEVVVYFASVATITPDAQIKVALHGVGEDGMPDDEWASATLRADELEYSDATFEETVFRFPNPVEIEEDFFVVVSGFPNNSTDEGTDDIAMFCSPVRPEGGKCTAYHLLEEWDENDQPTGKLEWMENVDSPLSFALCPLLDYGNHASGVSETSLPFAPAYWDGSNLHLDGSYDRILLYNSTGTQVYAAEAPAEALPLPSLPNGIYIVECWQGTVRQVGKIWIH